MQRRHRITSPVLLVLASFLAAADASAQTLVLVCSKMAFGSQTAGSTEPVTWHMFEPDGNLPAKRRFELNIGKRQARSDNVSLHSGLFELTMGPEAIVLNDQWIYFGIDRRTGVYFSHDSIVVGRVEFETGICAKLENKF